MGILLLELPLETERALGFGLCTGLGLELRWELASTLKRTEAGAGTSTLWRWGRGWDFGAGVGTGGVPGAQNGASYWTGVGWGLVL